MSDYQDAEDVLNLYAHQTEKEISELNKTIVALRAKISLLEITLSQERERAKNLPIPPSIMSQIAALNDTVRVKDKEIEYYKRFVQPSVIINRKSKEAPTRGGGLKK
jgi:hypothetical protein|tara:strand:- start:14 stop:334 length:321 start_codon:yes stop_codon:yes gene_type:complete